MRQTGATKTTENTEATEAQGPSPSRRRRAPKGQGERLHEEILRATERLLIQTGDQDAVSIRAVADAVGVTPPSIYLHFADKSELIFAVCERNFAMLDRVIEEAATGVADPVEALRRRGAAYVRFGLEHPEQYRILFMTKASETPNDWTPDRTIGSAAFTHLVTAVQACLEAGAIAPADPVLIASGLWAAVHGVTSLLIAKRGLEWPLEELVDHVLRVQIRGLRPPDPRDG